MKVTILNSDNYKISKLIHIVLLITLLLGSTLVLGSEIDEISSQSRVEKTNDHQTKNNNAIQEDTSIFKSPARRDISDPSGERPVEKIVPEKPDIKPINSIKEGSMITLSSTDYTPTGAIDITSDSDTDLTSFPGSGTFGDPYRIYDLNITLDNGINEALSIENTQAYIHINHSYFNIKSQNNYGIYLSNATNIKITYSEFVNSSDSIRLENVNDTMISYNNMLSGSIGVSGITTKNVKVSFNYIQDSFTGILFKGTDTLEVLNNSLSSVNDGIYLRGTTDSKIINNSVHYPGNRGILIDRDSDLTISVNNTIVDNDIIGGTSIQISNYAESNRVENNTLINSEIGVRLIRSYNTTVSNNILQNASNGVYIENSSANNTIEHNQIYKLYAQNSDLIGIYLRGTDSNTKVEYNFIHNNTIVNSTYGLFSYQYVYNNEITNNTVYTTSNFGFQMQNNVMHNTIKFNTVSHASDGFYFQTGASNNILNSNTIYNTTSYGIYVTSTSQYNIINDNYVSLSRDGISLGAALNDVNNNVIINSTRYGIHMYDYTSNITNNKVYNSSSYGIYSQSSNAANISGNYVYSGTYGLYLSSTSNSFLHYNEIHRTRLSGLVLSGGSSNDLIGNIIYDNALQGNYANLFIGSSNYNVLENNTIHDNPYYGISISNSIQTVLRYNNISNNLGGLYTDSTSQTILEYNVIVNNGNWGIKAVGSNNQINHNKISIHTFAIYLDKSDNNQIFNNSLGYNDNGLYIISSSYNTISRNTIYNSYVEGIYFDWRTDEYTTSNNILNNTLYNNTGYAIYLPSVYKYGGSYYVSSITVKWNDFVANNNGGTQGSSGTSSGNIISQNYWSDLGSDSYYTFDGGLRDTSPLLELINIANISFLTPVYFINPKENGGTYGQITLSWQNAVDSTGLVVHHAIYYSSDGNIWLEIANNLLNSSLFWDASFLSEATYKLKINATNIEGKTSEQTIESFTIDKSGPEIVEAPGYVAYEYNVDYPQYCFTATDDNPFTATIYNVDYGGNPNDFYDEQTYFTSGSETCLYPQLFEPGGYNYEVELKDEFGSTTIIYTFLEVVDTIVPTISSPGNTEIELGNSGQITWNFNDNSLDWGLDLQIDINGTNEISTTVFFSSYSFDISSLPLGDNNITFSLTDFGGNSVTDNIIVSVVDTTPPQVSDKPSDIEFEFGSEGNRLNYTLTDLSASTYDLIINGELNSSGVWFSGQITSLLVDNLDLGTNNVTMVFYDLSDNQVIIQSNVTVYDSIGPMITANPNNFTYELGSTNNIVTYAATDNKPLNYSLYIDGSFIKTGIWESGISFDINVDGLSLGSHAVLIIFMDESYNQNSHVLEITVEDTILPVIIERPSDFSVEKGTDILLNWSATDLNPDTYNIYIDEVEADVGKWNTGEIFQFILPNAQTGTYNVTIIIIDGSGNSIQDTVLVSVTEIDESSDPPKSDDPTDDGDDENVGFINLNWMYLVVSIFVLSIISRRKNYFSS